MNNANSLFTFDSVDPAEQEDYENCKVDSHTCRFNDIVDKTIDDIIPRITLTVGAPSKPTTELGRSSKDELWAVPEPQH
jgi:hypothetical protein